MRRWAAAAAAIWIVAGSAAAGATYDCRTTPHGIPRKVIVKNRNAVAYQDQEFGEKSDRGEVRFFRKYFVFEETRQGYLVGEATVKDSIIGWVRRDDVLAWNTEQAVYLINKGSGRLPVRIWQSREDIGQVGKPCFEESLDREHTTEPFPILEKSEESVRVAFLWESQRPLVALEESLEDQSTSHLEGASVERAAVRRIAAPGGGSIEATGVRPITDGRGKILQIAQDVRRMDLVLVLDVTESMGPYMDEVKSRLTRIVESLAGMKIGNQQAEVFVGVVAYRDYLDQPTSFLTRSLDLTNRMADVNEFLDSLAPGGGGGRNEAIDDALKEACERMSWGPHSFRVLCLVGDAPPHTPDDEDTKYLDQTNTYVASEFFGRPASACLARTREILDAARVHLFMLGVGKDPEVRATFPRYVRDPQHFLALDNAQQFIATLEAELQRSRQAHNEAVGHVRIAADPSVQLSDLGEEVYQTLTALNIDPESLRGMRGELIQTGWFAPQLGADAAVCVYMRRRDLEEWGVQLRNDLLAYREKEEDILKGIAGRHLGPIETRGIGDLLKVFNDVAYTPDVFRLESLSTEEEVKVQQLRKKLNNLEILLLMDKLFSKYEEGWVPMEYLPGSLSDLRTSSKPQAPSR